MIIQLIKKELLMVWRRPRELVILLFMPFVLITILGAALGSIINGDAPDLDIKLAVIQKDDIDDGEEKMIKRIEDLPISPEEKTTAIEGIKSFNPIKILRDDIFGSVEFKDSIRVVEMESAPSAKESLEYSGVLEVPAGFTEQFYRHAFLNEDEIPSLNLKLNESYTLEGGVLNDIFSSFQDNISLWSALPSLGIDQEMLQNSLISKVGNIETVTKKKPINAVTYYAIGMCVMFMFYVAGNSAALALEEKENQIYGRILLANVPIPTFFIGIFVSTIIVTFIQMNILFGLSALIHDVRWPNTFDYFVVTLCLCLMVGGFAVFISAINYRLNSRSATQVFSSFLIPIIAFIGGSFIPVSQIGGFFETISQYSPGGAGISAYYKIMQGYTLNDISVQLLSVLITTILLLVLAFLIQPRRGESI
ncbi:ABC transporter permease [Cytobacillus massiliigabonensis]|uniref:ABC transporter permease n=1 Tax=Cytobacillus massiliigabonensis TaxID=1871011 RepID=UPI000C83741C|nr:ABC transporter permease [Cytobacillus massiliigabonensis]